MNQMMKILCLPLNAINSFLLLFLAERTIDMLSLTIHEIYSLEWNFIVQWQNKFSFLLVNLNRCVYVQSKLDLMFSKWYDYMFKKRTMVKRIRWRRNFILLLLLFLYHSRFVMVAGKCQKIILKPVRTEVENLKVNFYAIEPLCRETPRSEQCLQKYYVIKCWKKRRNPSQRIFFALTYKKFQILFSFMLKVHVEQAFHCDYIFLFST